MNHRTRLASPSPPLVPATERSSPLKLAVALAFANLISCANALTQQLTAPQLASNTWPIPNSSPHNTSTSVSGINAPSRAACHPLLPLPFFFLFGEWRRKPLGSPRDPCACVCVSLCVCGCLVSRWSIDFPIGDLPNLLNHPNTLKLP